MQHIERRDHSHFADSLAFRRFSRVYSFRILAVSSHRLLFGSSGLPYCGKLAHPRYVALLHNRAMIPSFAPNSRKQRLIALFLPFGAKLTVSLTLSFFPVRSLFVIFSFLLTMASFRFVRFAHSANLRTLALSLRSNAVYVPVFRSN